MGLVAAAALRASLHDDTHAPSSGRGSLPTATVRLLITRCCEDRLSSGNTSLLPSARRPATPASQSRWARRGDCFDNAVAESFFATLKKELVRRRSWPDRRELQSAVFDYIETFYNRERRHSTLGYLSPREFEMISLPQQTEEQKIKP